MKIGNIEGSKSFSTKSNEEDEIERNGKKRKHEKKKLYECTLIDHQHCLPSQNMVEVMLNEIYLLRVHDLRKQYESQREKKTLF